MRKYLFNGLVLAGLSLSLVSCTAYQRTIADSNSRVNFEMKDFAITPPYAGNAQETRILGIDWARLFTQRSGEITNGNGGGGSFSIPVIGSIGGAGKVDGYALYELVKAHPNNDAVFYPQFKRKRFNFLWIYTRTNVQVKARLGKLQTGTGDTDEAGE